MNIRTMRKLIKLDFMESWLKEVRHNWKPKKTGKYEMLIIYITNIDDDPKDGIFIEKTRFDDDKELSVIHYFFEGLGYILTVTETGKQIGQGIIDGSPFDECEYFEDGDTATYDRWQWHTYTLDDIKKSKRKRK